MWVFVGKPDRCGLGTVATARTTAERSAAPSPEGSTMFMLLLSLACAQVAGSEPGPPPDPEAGLLVTGTLGGAVPWTSDLSEIRPGPLVHLDLGTGLARSRSLDGVVELTGMTTRVVGEPDDPDGVVPSYRSTRAVGVLAAGLRLHASPDAMAVRPELTVTVGAAVHHIADRVSTGGVIGRSNTTRVGPAFRAAGGVAGSVSDSVQWVGRLGASVLPVRSDLTGWSVPMNLHLSLGIRVQT